MAIADAAGQAYMQQIANISKAFQPMDTNALGATLNQGGSLSGNLGFGAEGIDVMGLTPDQVGKLIAQRGEIQNQNQNAVAGMATLSDMLTGGKETRAAMLNAQGHIFDANAQGGLQAERLGAEKERQQAGFDFNATENKLTREQQQKLHADTLAEQERFHDMVYGPGGTEYRKLTQDDRHFKDTLKLKREEMMVLKGSADSAAQTGNTVALVAKLGELKTKALDNMSAKDGDAATKNIAKGDYFKYHMMESSLTSPVGSVYDSKDYVTEAKGYPQLMLAPDGNWYGIKRDPKTNVISGSSATPIVYNPINVSRMSTGGSGSKIVKKHQP